MQSRSIAIPALLYLAMLPGCVKHSPTIAKPAGTLVATVPNATARQQLANLYRHAAEAIKHDGTFATPRLRSTLDVAEYVQRLNQYVYIGPNRLATDEFARELDSRWLAAFGKSDEQLTAELRAKCVMFFEGVANDL